MPKTNRHLKRCRILLTEGSSTSARQTLYALGDRHIIEVLDPSPFCQCRFSRYVRRWIRCPSFSREPLEYLRFLASRLKAERYDILFPTHEQAYLLARVRKEIQQYAGLAVPEFSAIDQMQDKANFIRAFDQLNLPYPPTAIVRTRSELERAAAFPCFIKLAHSTAGTGVYRIANPDNLQDVVNQLDSSGLLDGESEFLVQQPGTGKLSIVQSVFQHGSLVAVHCAEARMQGIGGAPMARESVWHPHVVDDVKRLGKHLSWHGALFLEYFHDAASGKIQYLEANPRIGETFNAVRSGVNLCEQLVRVSLGENVPILLEGKVGVRTHQSFMIAMSAASDGKSRQSLLADLYDATFKRNEFRHSDDELTRLKDDLPSFIPAAAVVLRLILTPSSASRIVENTVANYSLPESAASVIRALTESDLKGCFD